MDKLLERIRWDEDICLYLKTVKIQMLPENLSLYRAKIKNKEELADRLLEYWETQGFKPSRPNPYVWKEIKL